MRDQKSWLSTRHGGPLALGVVALAIGLGLPLGAQLNRMPTVQRFKVIERFSPREMLPGQTNQVKTLLTGAEAKPQSGGLVLVRQMRIENLRPDGETNIIIRAPECIFDYAERTAQSTGRLDFASADGQFLISGRQGFTCWLTNTHIIVSNRVRTEIQYDFKQPIKP